MSQIPGIAVTYTGSDDPFVDRLYRSGLTFDHGQTRTIPPLLAERFLRHEDVFKRVLSAEEVAAEADAEAAAGLAESAETTVIPGLPVDDTQLQLDAARKLQDDQQKVDEARFQMLNNIEGMDKLALLNFVQDKFGQKLPANTAEAKLRERARGMVDQFGVP